MPRKLIKAPAPYSGYVLRSEDGMNYLITDQCVSVSSLTDSEIDEAEAISFDITIQGVIDNAKTNYSEIVSEETVEAISLEIQTAIENFE
jgi:hypothetical protein